jgi:hypothetical protein
MTAHRSLDTGRGGVSVWELESSRKWQANFTGRGVTDNRLFYHGTGEIELLINDNGEAEKRYLQRATVYPVVVVVVLTLVTIICICVRRRTLRIPKD